MTLILMEVVIMDRQGLLVSKISLLCFLLFFGCDFKNNSLFVNEDSSSLDLFKKNVTYKGELFNGAIFSTNKFGDTVSLGEYKNGLKNGIWKKFYENGSLKEEREYRMGLKTGFYNGFYNDGSKNFIYQFKNGEYNGKNSLWAKGGQLIEEFNYKMGYEYGSQKVWYLNGRIKSNYIIKNNRRYGLLGTKNCTNVSEEVFGM